MTLFFRRTVFYWYPCARVEVEVCSLVHLDLEKKPFTLVSAELDSKLMIQWNDSSHSNAIPMKLFHVKAIL